MRMRKEDTLNALQYLFDLGVNMSNDLDVYERGRCFTMDSEVFELDWLDLSSVSLVKLTKKLK